MSDQPRNDDDLQALLEGKSAISRRYREAGEELPPAHVDAAILAASHRAIDSEKHSASGKRRHSWWSGPGIMRWSLPLSTVAVVVIATSLILTIERDPEMVRLDEKYEQPSAEAQEERANTMDELALSDQAGRESAVATPPSPSTFVSPQPQSSVSQETTLGKTGSQKDMQSRQPERKRRDSPQRRSAEAPLARSETPALAREKAVTGSEDLRISVGEERFAAPVEQAAKKIIAEERLAEAFVDHDDQFAANEPADTPAPASISADVTSEQIAVAEVTGASDSASLDEKEETRRVQGESSLRRQHPARVQMESAPIVAKQFAERDVPVAPVESEAMIDPQEWINEIEQLLAAGRRDEAITMLEEFRLAYPEFQLPDDLLSLLPASTE